VLVKLRREILPESHLAFDGQSENFSRRDGPGFSFPSRSMAIKHIDFSRIKKEAMIDFRVPFAILDRS
jgi:hypothetical protein